MPISNLPADTTSAKPISASDAASNLKSASNKSPQAYAWLLAAVLLMAVTMRSPIVMLSPMAQLLKDTLGVSSGLIGVIGAIPMLAFALSSFVAPVMARRFGLEYTLIAASLVLGLAIIMRALWADVALFVVATLVLSVAISLGNVLIPAVIKKHARPRLSQTTGWYSMTLSACAGLAAGLAMPVAMLMGWQLSLGMWGVFALLAVFFWWGFVKRADMTSVLTTGRGRVSLWRSPLAWWIALFLGIQSMLYYTLASFLGLLLNSRGISDITAGNAMLLFQVSALPSALFLARWVASGGSLRLIAMTASVFNVLGLTGFAFLSVSGGWLWLWALLSGVGCALIFTLSLMMFGLKTSDDGQAAALSGMAQGVGYGVAGLGPLMTGVLKDSLGSFALPMTVLIALMLFNCLCAWRATADGRL